mmetsp:Transcript_7998/g.9214  ORF Transcript_7998/g.9214 Transcript_7998/m.9214 type:complete len:972 (+) Transcript_7998:57-2972(+)
MRSQEQLDLNKLRSELLSCSEVSPNSEAMQLAIATLENVQKLLQQEGSKSQSPARNNDNSDSDARISAVDTPTSASVPSSNVNVSPLLPRFGEAHDSNNNSNVGNSSSRSRSNRVTVRSSSSSRIQNILFKMIRTFLIDFPLIAVFLLTIATLSLSYMYEEYLNPQLEAFRYTEDNRDTDISYYHRACPPGEMSTRAAEDLYIGDDFTTEECVEHMMVHGMSLYKNLIKPETAKSLRDWVIEKNKKLKDEDAIGVIENENRWSFGIGANDHPTVATALNEITTHEKFRSALETIAGDNPALIEMTAITAGYGAADQFWHPDVVSMGSPAKFVRNFVPSYALFLTLQDTTSEMGATEVCPGTYMCGNEDASDTCENFGFQVSGKNNLWKTGDAILMNQQSFHRGAAHVDPHAPNRVVFIITFSPRPMVRGETRALGQGGSYSLRWDMWGHTLKDLENAPSVMVQPWTTLRALGLYKPKNADWGWDLITQHSSRCINENTGYENHNDFLDMIRIPSFLRVDFTERMSYTDFFESSIIKWFGLAIRINVAVIVFYGTLFGIFGILTVILSIRSQHYSSLAKGTFYGIISTVLRLTVLYSIIAASAYYAKYKISESVWAKEIKNGTYYTSPFVGIHKDETLLKRKPVVVTKDDVLVTDRFNAKVLHSLTDTLDYHPGNMKLGAVVKGAASMFKYLNSEDKSRLVKRITNDVLLEDTRFSVMNDDATWVAMTLTESEEYVSKELYLQGNPLISSLNKEAEFLLSFYRYGNLKSSIMARKFGPEIIHSLSDKIFSGQAKLTLMSNNKVVTKVWALKDFNLFRIGTLRRKERGINTTINSLSKGLLSTNHDRNKLSLLSISTPDFEKSLEEGDEVEGQYNMIHNEWYKGKIIKIYQGAQMDVEYLDGEIDFLGASNVVRFQPYQPGEILEVTGLKNYGNRFVKAEVLYIIPEGKDLVVRILDDRSTHVVGEAGVRRFY